MYEDCSTDSVATSFAVKGSARSTRISDYYQWNGGTLTVPSSKKQNYWLVGDVYGEPPCGITSGGISSKSYAIYRSSSITYLKS